MTMHKLLTSATVVLSLAAGQFATTSAASAGEYRGYRSHSAPRFVAPRPHYDYGHRPRRDRTGDAVGAAILGIGALIVGAAIADAARNKRRHYD